MQVELGESLTARTECLCQLLSALHIIALIYSWVNAPLATFRELGPPDLCHVVKSTGKSGQRDVSVAVISIA